MTLKYVMWTGTVNRLLCNTKLKWIGAVSRLPVTLKYCGLEQSPGCSVTPKYCGLEQSPGCSLALKVLWTGTVIRLLCDTKVRSAVDWSSLPAPL